MILVLIGCSVLGVVPDLDHDGSVGADCRPTDPASEPTAPEVADGVDNNCDGVIDEGTVAFDDDGDGLTEAGGDCDDADATVLPGAAEVADGRDDDCDGTIDEGTDAHDDDGDGWAEQDGDCDDADPLRSPGEAEACDDVDQDCDELVDEGFDLDGDGWTTCAGDTADAQPDVHPGAEEACDGVDNDLDREVDEGCDGDGDGYTTFAGDCDDGKDFVHPGAPELCDTFDDDCDGYVDERDPDADDPDRDGHACAWDCDEALDTVHVGATETWNGRDDDCDGVADEGFDLDGDGSVPPEDCDDLDAARRPAAPELCNGQDDNCDGELDEGFDADGDEVSSCWGDCDDADALVFPGARERLDGGDDDCDGVADNDIGLLVAAETWIGLPANGTHTSTLPLPEGPWDEYTVGVFVDSAQDSNNYCGWFSEVSESTDSVDVTVTLRNCGDHQGVGYAAQYSVVLFASSGAAVDLAAERVGTGPGSSLPSSVTVNASGSGSRAFAAPAVDTLVDGGEEDMEWHFVCSEGASSYACDADDNYIANSVAQIEANAIFVDGFDNAAVTVEAFEVTSSASVEVAYDPDQPDHLTFVGLRGLDTSTANGAAFTVTRATTSDSETFTLVESAQGRSYGDVYLLEGDFLYWLNGSWTY